MLFQFPLKGIHKGFSTEAQPELTAFAVQNVRPYDTLENRARGGQRPGLDKWGAGTQIGGVEQPVVALVVVNSVV